MVKVELNGIEPPTFAMLKSSPIEGSSKRRSYAVLHVPPVDSREKAVRASIVQHFKKGIIT